jgi:peptidyl-dipeptidase Dcp
MWATWPEVLKNYAKHYKTGEVIPQALVDKITASNKFNQGFATTEYLAASLLDQRWHQLTPAQIPSDAIAFEKAALKEAGVDFAPVPPRYRSMYFSHIRRRLLGWLLRLSVERSTGRRYRRMV